MNPIERIDALIAKWEEEAEDARYAAGRAKQHGMQAVAQGMNHRAIALGGCVKDLKALREALAKESEKEN